jgi:hypothetical protein
VIDSGLKTPGEEDIMLRGFWRTFGLLLSAALLLTINPAGADAGPFDNISTFRPSGTRFGYFRGYHGGYYRPFYGNVPYSTPYYLAPTYVSPGGGWGSWYNPDFSTLYNQAAPYPSFSTPSITTPEQPNYHERGVP